MAKDFENNLTVKIQMERSVSYKNEFLVLELQESKIIQ